MSALRDILSLRRDPWPSSVALIKRLRAVSSPSDLGYIQGDSYLMYNREATGRESHFEKKKWHAGTTSYS